jgi:DNA invertase Pin-like site-specific DNA recombinase
MLNMLATLAEYERELIVERVNAGITAARQGSRATLYRHQQALAARESATM